MSRQDDAAPTIGPTRPARSRTTSQRTTSMPLGAALAGDASRAPTRKTIRLRITQSLRAAVRERFLTPFVDVSTEGLRSPAAPAPVREPAQPGIIQVQLADTCRSRRVPFPRPCARPGARCG